MPYLNMKDKRLGNETIKMAVFSGLNGVSSVNVDRKFGPSRCSYSIDRYQSCVSTSLLDDALLLSVSS